MYDELTLQHGAELHVGPHDLGDAVDVSFPASVDVCIVDVVPVGRVDGHAPRLGRVESGGKWGTVAGTSSWKYLF